MCLCKGNGLFLQRCWLVTHARETILDHFGSAWSKRQFSNYVHKDQLPNPANIYANSYCSQRSGHLRLEQRDNLHQHFPSEGCRETGQDARIWPKRVRKRKEFHPHSSTLWLIFNSFLAHENHTGTAVSQPSSPLTAEYVSPVSLLPIPCSRTKASSCARCLLTFRAPWKRPTNQPVNERVTLKINNFKG